MVRRRGAILVMGKLSKTEILLSCLAHLHRCGPVSLQQLATHAGCSTRTVYRALRTARTLYGVEVELLRDEGHRGQGYQVQCWGVFNPEALAAKYGEVVDRGGMS